MITSLMDLRVDPVELVHGDVVEVRVEIFADGQTPLISLVPAEALVLAYKLRQVARSAK